MQQKRTILFVITQGGPWGGAQKYVYDLATDITEAFDVVVAAGEPFGPHDLQKKLREHPGIRVAELRHLRRDISPIHDLLAVFELRRLYKKIKPDIVHLNSSKASIIGSFASGYKLVYTVHGWVFHEPMNSAKRLLYRVLERFTAKKKSKIIVLSPHDETAGITLGLLPHKLAVIPPGIEAPVEMLSRHDARAKLRERSNTDIPMDAVWIGTIANHYPTKGLDILLRALTNVPAQTVIVGDGPERQKLEALKGELHLDDRVHFAGFLSDASQYLPAFDLFVLASRKEGLSYTLLEAKLHGIPIVATDVGGVSSIVQNKKTGTLVEKENILALAEALSNAVLHMDQARQMAEAGMHDAEAERFSKKRMIEDTTALYRELLREAR